MKKIDLHVHSTASDGSLTPSELVLHAKEKGLSAIALTDHDTIAGIEECMRAGEKENLMVIPGVELASEYNNQEIHILGYFIDIHSTVLSEKLRFLIESRNKRNDQVLEKLNALGCSINKEDLFLYGNKDTVVTRAHFAAALLAKGYVKDYHEAFDKYLKPGRPAYVKRVRFTPSESISMIHAAGGIASLAHPTLYGMNPKEVTHMIKELAQIGLDAIESLYSTYTGADTMRFMQLCKNYDLIPTGGSDFHGQNKPNLEIGIGYGYTEVPYELLEAINKRVLRYKKCEG